LTIDRVIQEIAEEELGQGVRQVGAKGGFAIVSDPHTGRILAVANYPSFDPNHLGKFKIEETRNSAFLDTFEPGSVIKPFVIAKALDQKLTHLDERHQCENGALRIGKHVIHDTHGADQLSTLETVIRSSNICTYKIAAKLGKDGLYDALTAFGFASDTSRLGYPGEGAGRLSASGGWQTIRFANISFGHGFATTGLEIVQAMGAIANGGHLMKPALVEKVVSSDGLVVSSSSTATVREVISPDTARHMRQALKEVVTDPHGTGKKAQTALYTTAGKTGTAQKVISGIKGYAKGKYISSFIGFTPVQDPHLVVYVLIDEPSEKVYYGGETAAPVFARIAERSLKYLNVAPDVLQVSEKDKHESTKPRM
jgi:cell division protein FtsI (penicillin-binding protein 3)